MELFFMWLLFGVVAAVVAWNKGLSVPGWLVIGFLLGPFGLVLALVVGKDGRVLDERAVTEGRMRKCPSCAEVIKPEAVKCRFCGTEMPVYEPPGTVLCRSCGKRIKPRAKERKCYVCKSPLQTHARSGS